MIYPNGKQYIGEFKVDKRHGRGKQIWPDGREYDGEWVQGKQFGMGSYITKEGETKRGLWINGKFQTWHDDEEVMKSVKESIQDPQFVDMLDRFKSDRECMKTLEQFKPRSRGKSNSFRNIFKS